MTERGREHGKAEAFGGIRFMIDVAVDASAMAAWSPERISAFFDGIAQARRAVNGEVEEDWPFKCDDCRLGWDTEAEWHAHIAATHA